MPTANPRVNVTLKPEQYELLSRLSSLQGRSRSAVLLELFETVLPVLERVVVVGEAAQRAQVQAKEGLRESVERAEAAILPHVTAAMGQFDLLIDDTVRGLGALAAAASARERSDRAAAAPRPPSPRPVTRGPGRGPTRGQSAGKNGRSGSSSKHRRRG